MVYGVQLSVQYSEHCTLYTVQCTLYTVQCTLYTVQCTVYILVYNALYCKMYTQEIIKIIYSLIVTSSVTWSWMTCVWANNTYNHI